MLDFNYFYWKMLKMLKNVEMLIWTFLLFGWVCCSFLSMGTDRSPFLISSTTTMSTTTMSTTTNVFFFFFDVKGSSQENVTPRNPDNGQHTSNSINQLIKGYYYLKKKLMTCRIIFVSNWESDKQPVALVWWKRDRSLTAFIPAMYGMVTSN